MSCTREKILEKARSWIGFKESDGSHRDIINVYNAHKPLARSYKVTYKDAWCATFVSAVAIACGATDIIPTECSCQNMIGLFKKLGCWVENDAYAPAPGDIIFYDWQDSGTGDNTSWSDHVGIVEKTENGKITAIEGNYSDSVKRRTLAVNGKYIRGFGVPRYDTEATAYKPETETNTADSVTYSVKLPMLQNGSVGASTRALQTLLIGYGYSCGKWGADGEFGSDTLSAVKQYQKDNGCTVDGKVGSQTWGKLLGVS